MADNDQKQKCHYSFCSPFYQHNNACTVQGFSFSPLLSIHFKPSIQRYKPIKSQIQLSEHSLYVSAMFWSQVLQFLGFSPRGNINNKKPQTNPTQPTNIKVAEINLSLDTLVKRNLIVFSNTLEISTGIILVIWGTASDIVVPTKTHSIAGQLQGSQEVVLQSQWKAQPHLHQEHLARAQKFRKVGKAPCCRCCLYIQHSTSSCFSC